MAAMGQREMRGAVGNRKGGGGDEIHRVGDRHHRGGVEHDFLGIAAAVAQHREHPLPGLQAVDRAAGLDDLAGGFEPRGERERRLHLIGAADHQAVGEVDAGGAHPDAHLVRLEARALDLFEPQHIGSAPFAATDRLHLALLALATARIGVGPMHSRITRAAGWLDALIHAAATPVAAVDKAAAQPMTRSFRGVPRQWATGR